jgi:Mg2+-importing ATPase
MLSVAGASLILPFLPMLPKQILLTNLISDMPFMTIASDRVDEDQLKKPGKWDLKLIRKYMITFGLHSSIFDALTFYALFFVLKLSDINFQSGWFMESTLTELIILFVIRTKVSIFKSKPSALLVIFGISAIAITLTLPISPFAPLLSLSIKNSTEFLTIIMIIIAYFITAEFLKIIFYRIQEKHHAKSI